MPQAHAGIPAGSGAALAKRVIDAPATKLLIFNSLGV